MPTKPKPTASNVIGAYIHCGRCLRERPDGMSMKEWSALSVGFTKLGLQVWCDRHEQNLIHIDFEGQKHPANTGGD